MMRYFKATEIIEVYLFELPRVETELQEILASAMPVKVYILGVPIVTEDDFYRYCGTGRPANQSTHLLLTEVFTRYNSPAYSERFMRDYCDQYPKGPKAFTNKLILMNSFKHLELFLQIPELSKEIDISPTTNYLNEK